MQAEQEPLEIVTDPEEAARHAGLRYVTDEEPGIRRRRAGRYFSYVGPDGNVIRDPEVLQRIRSLAIPPAYRDVWICPDPDGHIQATARDGRGRKQYRYHPRWREERDDTKFNRMILFGKTLPHVRERVDHDLALKGMPREKVLAAVVKLLETTMIRVGNEEYARANKSFGLTTMRNRHVDIEGTTIHFHFRGKHGKKHRIDLRDRRLAGIVKRCRELPGQALFQYRDETGKRQSVGSGDVNAYLREITGQDFTAKDFRTWAGTVLAALALQECEVVDSAAGTNRNIVRAIETVAERLGNTPAVCRKCYIHPAVLDAYREGAMLETLKQRTKQELSQPSDALRPEEEAVLSLLEKRLEQETEKAARESPGT